MLSTLLKHRFRFFLSNLPPVSRNPAPKPSLTLIEITHQHIGRRLLEADGREGEVDAVGVHRHAVPAVANDLALANLLQHHVRAGVPDRSELGAEGIAQHHLSYVHVGHLSRGFDDSVNKNEMGQY